MEIVNIKVVDLRPYEKNAKKHSQTQIDNVAKSIEKYGFVQPLVIDKNNVVIIGHCRLEASKKLKLKEVPCVLADTLTDEQVKELRLLDNKLNESDFDFDLLSEELADLDLRDFELDWGILDYPDKEELEENGGVIEENNSEVAVSIVFKNTMEWRKYEDKLREFFKEIDDVKIKVGEYNEIEHSNTDSI